MNEFRFEKITASNNEKFKSWLSLLKSSGIKTEKQFVLFGKKVSEEVLRQNPEKIRAVVFETSQTNLARELSETFQRVIENGKTPFFFELSRELFSELDVFGIKHPLFICETPEIKPWSQSSPKGLELILALQDPSNLGAVLRSCLNFNVQKVILLKECSHPMLPKSIRAFSSNPYSLHFEFGPSLKEITPKGDRFFALDSAGKSLSEHVWPQDCTLLLGEEGQGLPTQIPKQLLIGVPQSGKGESLNAMVAASIALYDHFTHHNKNQTK
jgi:TrmH family RNA methyltransferase